MYPGSFVSCRRTPWLRITRIAWTFEGRVIFTIDGADAKDYDDAIAISGPGKGAASM